MKRKPKHISQNDWDSVDSPPLTTKQMRGMRPIAEVDPALLDACIAGAVKRRGRPALIDKRLQVSLRLDPAIIEAFKATGAGWQTRINAVLMEHLPR